MRLLEAFDKETGKLVAWCGVPETWNRTDAELMEIYKRQVQRAKGVEVYCKIS